MNCVDAVELQDPRNRKEAIASTNKDKLENAMNKEIVSLHEKGTWDLVQLPPDRKSIGSKWLFKVKQDSQGNDCRFKARLVAQGFSQKYGIDYDEVFAPVVKQTTIRTLLAVAGKQQMSVRHYDVKTAFLNGDLKEDIFMKQPEGYEEPGQENLVCKLRKSYTV